MHQLRRTHVGSAPIAPATLFAALRRIVGGERRPYSIRKPLGAFTRRMAPSSS
jgi:hypothetical protein